MVSSVFETVIRKYSTYRANRAPLEAWIIGIAKIVVSDYFRSMKNYRVKAANSYYTDSIPNISGYEFSVDGKSFKVLEMSDNDFAEFNFEDDNNDFLKKVKIAKNNTKPYIAFIEKDNESDVLDDFTNIEIK